MYIPVSYTHLDVYKRQGIANVNIESQIGEYNKMVLDRNRLIANSSEKNPDVYKRQLAISLPTLGLSVTIAIIFFFFLMPRTGLGDTGTC